MGAQQSQPHAFLQTTAGTLVPTPPVTTSINYGANPVNSGPNGFGGYPASGATNFSNDEYASNVPSSIFGGGPSGNSYFTATAGSQVGPFASTTWGAGTYQTPYYSDCSTSSHAYNCHPSSPNASSYNCADHLNLCYQNQGQTSPTTTIPFSWTGGAYASGHGYNQMY